MSLRLERRHEHFNTKYHKKAVTDNKATLPTAPPADLAFDVDFLADHLLAPQPLALPPLAAAQELASITAILPPSGTAGTPVALISSQFVLPGDGHVWFGAATTAPPLRLAPNVLQVVAPPLPTQQIQINDVIVDVVVQHGVETLSSPLQFIYMLRMLCWRRW